MAREELGCEEFVQPSVSWWLRPDAAHREILPLPPGWRSRVHFFTTPPK